MAREGQPIELDFQLAPVRAEPPPAAPHPAPRPAVAAAPPARGAPEAAAPAGLTRRRQLALAVGAAGVVAASTGVVLGLWAKQLEDATYELCPSPTGPCPSAPEARALNDLHAPS